MKQVIMIGFLILSLSSCGQTKNTKIESILLDCLTNSYSEQQVDINKELDELENYLINSKSLESSSGQSYYFFYKQIAKSNEISATLDYERFEGIYKLKPNDFYEFDCLEKLKSIDSTSISKSKYHQMSLAIQNASSDGMTPSNIASAITGVLSPSDFEHPYYRAIALLTIAHTSDSDQGILRQLQNSENQDYSDFKKIEIALTDKNETVLSGKTVNQSELKIALKEFVKVNRSEHLINFQADMGTSYDFYVKVQDLITTVYNELRIELAIEKFNQPYNELTEDQKIEIRRIYPKRIKE